MRGETQLESEAIARGQSKRIPLVDQSGIPTRTGIGYLERLLVRRFDLDRADAEDIVSEALLNYSQVPESSGTDGLLLVVVRRRAVDFLRRARQGALLAAPESAQPDAGVLETREIMMRAVRFAQRFRTGRRRRFVRVARDLLGGASFPEACRDNGIPRGSRERYLESPRKCFTRPVWRLQGGAGQSRVASGSPSGPPM